MRGSGVLLLRDWRSCLALVHYDSSPVGAYDEFAVVALTWCGPRVTEMLVTSDESRGAGRALWGFPKILADLEWRRDRNHITFRRGREYFRIHVLRFSVPLRAKFRTVQTLNETCVHVPFEIIGKLRLGFRRRQLALILEDFEMRVYPPQKL